ncbi:hypothetical protein B0H14DRAFT_2638650 [Mycena olivaceomarginata]|nr:hypothetical protein B0H14DRAFT_2638650 [Mycena olivaceomarginata]
MGACYLILPQRRCKTVLRNFRSLLELDRTYSAAWALMGINLEMTNPQAAVEWFRRAIDVNPKDYRAWSGLGKAYSVLGMHSYSLHYHSRALRLRPEDAIACFKHALEAHAPHPMTVFIRLAQLLVTVNDPAGAASYAQAAVAQGETHAHPVEYYAKVLVAVAEYQAPPARQGLGARARDRTEDDREIDMEERKVLYGDTAGDRSELAVLQLFARPNAHAKSERLGWWL